MSSFSQAQNFTYLNASGGNSDQSVTCPDSSVIINGVRFVKVDKNMNIVWAKTMNGFSISNILLSKTGSIFFSNSNTIGKLNADGTLNWVNDYYDGSSTVNSSHLMLDGDNNLIVSGTGIFGGQSRSYFIKLDTNGAILKTRLFDAFGSNDFLDFKMISDSANNYRFFATSNPFLNASKLIEIFNYSEALDVIDRRLCAFGIGYESTTNQGASYTFFKSRVGSSFYLGLTYPKMSLQTNTRLWRCDEYGFKWGRDMGNWVMSNAFNGFNEDEKGNVILLSEGSNGYLAFAIFDSTGVQQGTNQRYSSNHYTTSSHVHVIHNNNYFVDVVSNYIPSNPLTVGKINSSLTCTNAILSCSGTSTPIFTVAFNAPTKYVITLSSSVTAGAVSAANDFSLAANYCQVAGVEETDISENSVSVFPNPGNGVYKLKLPLKDRINELKVYDAVGREVLYIEHPEDNLDLNLQDKEKGIYFLKITAEGRTFFGKIIKE
jgi:hypothetical protein